MADDSGRRGRKKGKKKNRRNRSSEDEEAAEVAEAEPEVITLEQDEELAPVEESFPEPEVVVEGGLFEDAIPAAVAQPDDPNVAENGGFTEDGLAVAMAVDTTGEDEYIYSAIEYDPDSKPPLYRNRRFRVYTCFAFVIIIAVVIVVVVYVTKNSKGDEIVDVNVRLEDLPTPSPTPAPITNREGSGIKEQIEAGVLQRGVNFTNMDERDHRYKALDWILHYDQMQLDSDEKNLYQRYVLALIAYSMDSLAWRFCGDHILVTNVTEDFAVETCRVQDTTGQVEEKNVWLSSTDECDWYGVVCSSDGVVRGLELIGNDLIGEIPPEISELRFLQYLAMNGNCIYGTIPPEFGKMSNLLSLELQGNGLSGLLPDEIYDASKLQLLNIAMQFNYYAECQRSDGSWVSMAYQMGDMYSNTQNLGLQGQVLGSNVNRWRSMKGLHLFDNSFSGSLDSAVGDLKYLVFLRAYNNAISGVIPNEVTNLKKLRELFLDQNFLKSDLPPDIGNMEDLEHIRMFQNELYGEIPETFYNLKKMKKIWLQDTFYCENDANGLRSCDISEKGGFTGSIQTEIGNLKKLTQLLVNNNPLTGTLPTELGLCEDLTTLHIHKTNITGSVPEQVCFLRDKNLHSEANTGVFYADCRPNNKTQNPFIACQCCTDCCDHTTKVCIADD